VKEALSLPPGAPGLAFLQCLPGYIHPRHRHDELELDVVVRGSAIYQVGERVYRIGRGSLVWLFPEQDHNVLEKSDDYTVWIVYWRPQMVRQALQGDPALSTLASGDPGGHFCRRVDEQQLKRLELALRAAEGAQGVALNRAALAFALTLSWSIFQGGSELEPAAMLHPAVVRAARLAASPDELPLGPLARRCGLSPARLSTLFARQMGMTLSAYRNQRRIERFLAEHDPRSGNLLASALAVGFGSYSQFHRVFSRVVGVSPQEWEREERQAAPPLDRSARGRRS
jgi:AraC-like DNA-binding protein